MQFCLQGQKNMYKNNNRGSVYKGCPLLIFLAVFMVVFVVAMLKSNRERIPKRNIYMRITEISIPLCQAGPPARNHMKNIYLTQVGSWKNQLRSHLGGLTHFSHRRIMFLLEFVKGASPPNRASPPPYEQLLKCDSGSS